MRRLSRLAFLWLDRLDPTASGADPAPDSAVAPATRSAVIEPCGCFWRRAARHRRDHRSSRRSRCPVPDKATSESERVPCRAPRHRPNRRSLININLTTQRMIVTEGGTRQYTWPCHPAPTAIRHRPARSGRLDVRRCGTRDSTTTPRCPIRSSSRVVPRFTPRASIHLLGTAGIARLRAPRPRPTPPSSTRWSPSRKGSHADRRARHAEVYRTADRPRPAGQPPHACATPIARIVMAATAAVQPRYVYPGDAPPRYYIQSNRQRAVALKKRRAAVRAILLGLLSGRNRRT